MEQKAPAKLAWFQQRARWPARSIHTTRFAASSCRCRMHPRRSLLFRNRAVKQWFTPKRKSKISTQRKQILGKESDSDISPKLVFLTLFYSVLSRTSVVKPCSLTQQ